MAKSILFLVVNRAENDPRVFRHARELAGRGFDVTCIGMINTGSPEDSLIDGVRVYNLGSRSIPADPRSGIGEYGKLQSVRRVVEMAEPGAFTPNLRQKIRYFARRNMPFLRRPLEWVRRLRALAGTQPLASTRDVAVERRSLNEVMFSTAVNFAMIEKTSEYGGFDCVVASDANTLLAGAALKEMTGCRLIYDAHEIYCRQYAEDLRSAFWRKFNFDAEKFLLETTDARFTVNASLAGWFAENYGADFDVIPNCPVYRKSEFHPAGNPVRVLFQGVFSLHRGLEQFIEAAGLVKNKDVLFVLRGRGEATVEQKLRRILNRPGLSGRIVMEPPVPAGELVRHAADSDIGVIPYVPVSLNNRFCLPNKIFEYMMAGLALACTDLPELSGVISKHDNGAAFDEVVPEKIAAAIDKLVSDRARLEEMKRRSLAAAGDEYNWAKFAPRFVRLFE